MTLNIRRVITDHDKEGKAVVAIDERCADVISRRAGHQSCVAWTGADGTIFRIVQYQPGVAPRKHRTETIDYAVVISGEIDMQLDDSLVHLRAGDVLVQQATMHDWVNRGTEPAARAPPDGYTLLMTASTLALNSVLYKQVPYDPVRDFAPITLAATAPNILIVHPAVPAKSLAEFIALAKQKPGALSYGTPGIGTSPHLCMELLKTMAGIDVQHVPYRGTAAAVTDVISGQIAVAFATALTAH